MKQSRSIIITASLIGAATIRMPAKPLLAHSGHSSQEEVEQPATDDRPSPTSDEQTEVQPQISPKDKKSLDSQNTAEEKQPTLTESEITPNSNPEAVTLESAPVDLVPIVGESLFVLLLASPFLLVAFKKWFYK